ncbi:MAG: hypothetical protein V4760_10365 [Bdellovibrionota bacterium]
MSGLSPSQLQYLKDVLGVDGVILGTATLAAAEAVSVQLPAAAAVSESRIIGNPSVARLLVFAAGERAFVLEGEAGDLASKMIQAMKLKPNDVAVVEWTGETPDDVRDIWTAWRGLALSFGERTALLLTNEKSESGAWIETDGRKLMVTDSPVRLLAEPARKKIAWAHLQLVMKALS